MKILQNSMLKGWKLLFLCYIALLACSFTYESISMIQDENSSIAELPKQNKKTVFFFPALQGNSGYTNNLKNFINNSYQIIEIDYHKIRFSNDDYSASTYAEIVKQLVESNQFKSFHVIGSGFGSVIAARFTQLNSEGVESLTLIDPEGILELELLGGYHLNKGVYSVASLTAWILENLTPDFGYFSETALSFQNFRTRLDTDLRTAKSYLKAVKVPTLIINSSNEQNTKAEIIKEFNRHIVTSKVQVLDKNLSLNETAIQIEEFIGLDKLESPKITVSRRIKSELPFSNSKIISAEGWLLTGLMLLIIFSTFFSEDLACIGAGLMVARGLMGFIPALSASFIGIFVGDILVYLSGKWFGKSATHKAPLKWFISEADIEQSKEWFHAKGPVIIIMSRFIPGTRFPTYFSAGAIGASFLMFISYFGIASLIWTPILVGASVVLGHELIYYFSLYQEYALVVLLIVVITALFTIKIVIPLFTFKGRRLLYGKFQRLINWEFWSPYILYSPIVIYSLYLWIKFKKITIPTAANPGIPEGGFIHESKSAILDKINSNEHVARYTLIEHTLSEPEKIQKALSFVVQNSLKYPIVLKPDKGERGKGVGIVQTENELIDKVITSSESIILQEFIEGNEFGLFYYRYPNKNEGSIFSITKKQKLCIYGDGKHNLEQLILIDSRAVCMAETHFKKHIHDLYKTPEKGEKVQLVELGTHSKGSLFLDGKNLITTKLAENLDLISKSFEGFYFGRYDVIVPTEKDLMNGKSLKILEVNGVTSESTNIYDPEHSFFFAIKTLMKQWKIAFEIGALNHKQGTKIPSLKHILSLIFKK